MSAGGARQVTRRLKALAWRHVLAPLGVPPRRLWPLMLPGMPTLHELRWRGFVATRPVLTAEEFGRLVPVSELEELTGCVLCGERRVQPLFHRRRPRFAYHVVRCPSCGHLYRNPNIRPERLGELYSRGNYSRFLGGRYERGRRRRYRLVLRAFSPLFDDGRGRRLLDVGCGNGLFLEVAHGRGFECYGVDLSADSVAAARERPGGERAFHGSPADVPEVATGGFDVVTLWSVLAHLPRPVEDITTLRRLLAPGGVLLVVTVNANALTLKRLRGDWGGFTPNHLMVYSPETLRLLLRRAGFAAVVVQPMVGDAIESGRSRLHPGQQRRIRRVLEHGNRGNMLRAVALADADGPSRLGLSP